MGAVETITDISEILEKDHQIEVFRRELKSEDGFHGMIGASSRMKRVYDLIANSSQSDASVVIYGESGTGKELVAQAIHEMGRRQTGPYVKVNCASLNEGLLESELFGHVKGAYTGAIQNRTGRFEAANRIDYTLRRLFIEEDAGFIINNCFARAPFSEGDHRRTASLGLDRNNPEIFFGGKNECFGLLHISF